MEYNPGLRATAKFSLNSFWGKWGENSQKRQTNYIYEPHKFLQFVSDPSKHVTDFYIINENTAQIQWKHVDDFKPEEQRTNIFLATFTTSWARLRLYNLLDMLGERILYHDTGKMYIILLFTSYEYLVAYI